jgi:hypothetical protein
MLAMQNDTSRYRHLDTQRIIETIRALRCRIEDRFPGSSLGQLAEELLQVSQQAVERSKWMQQPNMPLRISIGILVFVIPSLFILLLSTLKQFQVTELSNFLQELDAGISSIVFIGAAIVFLVNWERRMKRARALEAIHELRALAHILDMHQLTKDPESHFKDSRPDALPPGERRLTPAQLSRYLDYCVDALALISKIGALYSENFQDSVLLEAVDDLEDLTSGLSQKIWQKIMLLERMADPPPAG